ncbi:glycosyltransferase family 2 protein [Aneurinibacillus sp. REN35]|uniref:glycosyltransferase family 2 protein n=1 Tax=Aneurinibacillus sp. REN35 TaxID=3237286 RepID=UPI003527C84B
MEKVSIIIPFYNCPYISHAIESALNQTYPHIEIIVVDDGSTQYTEKLKPYLSRIRYFKKENNGTASALNLGVRNATGTYFAWLSSDDEYDPYKVEKQLAFMQKHDAAISYTGYFHIDANHQIIRQYSVHFPRKIDFYQSMMRGCHINGCTVMMKMEVFKKIGEFNEGLRYAQDYDFWLRVLPHYDFYFLDDPLVRYRVHDNMGTKKFQSVIPAETNRVRAQYYPVLIELMRSESRK